MTRTLGLAQARHRLASLDHGIKLHTLDMGQGPLVVLLHGFPDLWTTWRHLIPALVEAGFRVVAPSLRGYGASDKPLGLASYALPELIKDVAALIRDCGHDRAVVVGHDWGAIVAWWFAMRHPLMIQRLAILNVLHPARFPDLLGSPRRLWRSRHMLLLQPPWLPEHLLAAQDFYALRQLLQHKTMRPGAFSDQDIALIVEAFSQPGALTAAIHYYRAFAWTNSLRLRPTPIQAPVQILWGEQDDFLDRSLAEPPPRLVPNLRFHPLPDAGHWPHLDRPETTNRLLLDFLSPCATNKNPYD